MDAKMKSKVAFFIILFTFPVINGFSQIIDFEGIWSSVNNYEQGPTGRRIDSYLVIKKLGDEYFILMYNSDNRDILRGVFTSRLIDNRLTVINDQIRITIVQEPSYEQDAIYVGFRLPGGIDPGSIFIRLSEFDIQGVSAQLAK